MIRLFVEPGATYSWRQFVKEKPPFSIALDGIVNSPPKRIAKPQAPYANFDHHAKCDRVATRSTSEQVSIEINLGLMSTFRQNGIPMANVFVNDVDEDVCLAYWLLLNHERVVNHAEPSINRLVYCEDRMDATAGAYPLGDTAFRRQMAWIFEPYQRARFDGSLNRMGPGEMASVVEAVCARITAHTLNNGEELALDGNYERIGGGPEWTMVRESGPAARSAMYNDGITSFVAYLGETEDKTHRYVIGRRSVWIPFDVEKLFKALNAAEPVTHQGWGGTNTIGGSPRGTGSTLSPDKVESVVNSVLSPEPYHV